MDYAVLCLLRLNGFFPSHCLFKINQKELDCESCYWWMHALVTVIFQMLSMLFSLDLAILYHSFMPRVYFGNYHLPIVVLSVSSGDVYFDSNYPPLCHVKLLSQLMKLESFCPVLGVIEA